MAEINRSNDWKNELVLIAKNTFVWLFQLSQKYNKTISTLDQIPIEELQQLKELGITGIWLIGIWERSPASKTIKTLYGFTHAAASAYSIYSYQITDILGGRSSYLKFREAARSVGLKTGCDMVPNHTGIDSPWVIDHPDWFLEAYGNPSPDFTFTSPDLSSRVDVEIRIENGYYNRSGAAEVFSYVNKASGKERFLYHGNDGTSMPWNDTAQLNYLIPEVRDMVRRTIIEVAADFDIIRLDAAMTLTRQHYKRLWFPGDDGQRCIPSRKNFRMENDEFDQHMPHEFWSQVMQDMRESRPDTLLIAEAFWLMEGYFIREIGMDRVYNSAFMNMIKNEENRKFKCCLRDMATIKHNALDHLVNYQTTPDEESTINQFGASEKYFCAAALLCTLPGLPMFGHGQLEGYHERYGMDYLVPHMQELPDNALFEKHCQLVSPLLHNRKLFASAQNFLLLELKSSDSVEIDDVIVFTNSYQDQRILVVINNSWISHTGILDLSDMQLEGQKINLVSLRENHLQTGFRYEIGRDRIKFDLSSYAAGVFLVEEI